MAFVIIYYSMFTLQGWLIYDGKCLLYKIFLPVWVYFLHFSITASQNRCIKKHNIRFRRHFLIGLYVNTLFSRQKMVTYLRQWAEMNLETVRPVTSSSWASDALDRCPPAGLPCTDSELWCRLRTRRALGPTGTPGNDSSKISVEHSAEIPRALRIRVLQLINYKLRWN